MFHIKTDIRQYKCETAEKVERLIRNWVIRPSDLIYNSAEKTWNPIGQHPAFDDIFAGIEKEEANEPDTIVTEAPSEVAAEHEVEPGTELEADGGSPGDDETTNVRPAPSEASAASATNGVSADVVATPSIVIDADNATLAADSEEITNVTEAPEEPEAPDDEITDVREDPRRDTDEQDVADVPTPPEPSDDVEGLIRDSDEITMMTDKTFEMLSEENGKKASEPEANDAGESAADQQAEVDDDASDEADVAQDDEASGEEGLAEESEPGKSSGGGRHGLPEEVFVTDEIPRQDVQQAVLDELGELEEDADPVEEDDEVTEVIDRDADGDDGDERKSRWRIVMSDDIDEDEHLEDEPVDDEPTDDEPTDDEPTDDEPTDEVEAEVDPHSDTAEVASLDDDTPLEEADEEIEAHSAEDVDEDDDLDDMLDEVAELVGLGEGTDPVDIDDGALEPVGDHEEGEDGENGEARQRADTPVRAVVEPKEFISEGYNLPLPVDISPSKEDIRLGLKHSRVGRAIKDATFPYPQPKKRDEVSVRRFDLDPEDPADHSMLIVAAFVIGLLIIVLGAVTLLG